MKTKNLLSIFCATIAVAATSLAQEPGVYTLGRWNGDNGTNAALAPETSGTNTIATSEYNSGALMFTIKADGSTTGNAIVRTYRSLDSTKYETTGTTNLVALNGTASQMAIIQLNKTYLANVGTLRVVLDNTNAAVSLTNIVGWARFNAPSVRLRNN